MMVSTHILSRKVTTVQQRLRVMDHFLLILPPAKLVVLILLQPIQISHRMVMVTLPLIHSIQIWVQFHLMVWAHSELPFLREMDRGLLVSLPVKLVGLIPQ